MITEWFKQKSIERAERIVPRMTTIEILEAALESEKITDGWSRVLLKELAKRWMDGHDQHI
jgi:hypothetical protein